MSKPIKKQLYNMGYVIGTALFAISAAIIFYKLREYHYHDVVNEIKQIPPLPLLAALFLTIINYIILTGYDKLALYYIREPLKYRQIATASFIGYAFSMNTTVIGGSAARYRIYSSLGISAINVTRIVIFCAITFWLGFFSLSGISFLLHPQHIPEAINLPFLSIRPIGTVFLGLVLLYLLIVLFIKGPLRIKGWEFECPGFATSIGQIVLSSLDWIAAAAILYLLIPHSAGPTFWSFMGIYLLAQAAGLISTIPGGLGVFETVILLLMSNFAESSAIMGSLLVYRVIYYILPLIIASILLGLNEFLAQKHLIKHVSQMWDQFSRIVIPHVFAFTTFAAGAILLFSGTLPAVKGRMAVLRDLLPLPAIEISHFLGSIAGAALLILARGLQRRINAAYHITVIMLFAGIVFSMFKGLDYEEAIILSVMLISILPCKREFYRKSSLLGQSFSVAWIVSIIAVVACSIWLGLFSYKHVQYSNSLWWQFAFEANTPRFLRGMAAGTTFLLLYFFMKLQLPGRFRPGQTDEQALELASRIVQSVPNTNAWVALLGDKTFLFDESKNAFIMYAVEGRSWVTLGEPVGPQDKWQDLIWKFRELCDRYNGWPVFYHIYEENLRFYLDMDLSFLKLGEEAIVSLDSFSLSGASHGGFKAFKKQD